MNPNHESRVFCCNWCLLPDADITGVSKRYLSDTMLDLEFRHLWKVYEDLTGHKTPLIIVDSMGIYSHGKSLFAKIRGRCRTIGFAGVRAISLYLIPVFSSNCRSSDSEAMNMMEIVNHAKSVLGEEFKFCAGNAHTFFYKCPNIVYLTMPLP